VILIVWLFRLTSGPFDPRYFTSIE